MELTSLVVAFADAIKAVDARCAPYVSRSGREYQVGIGPYAENRAMELVVEELNARGLGPSGQFAPYRTLRARSATSGSEPRPSGSSR